MRLAFDRVVTVHGAAVLRVCRALVGLDDADDVWAETFLSAMRAYPDLPDDANLEAWLVTIARRKGIDNLRARARRATPVETLPERTVSESIGPAERLDLYAALAALPTRQRECVAFHHLGGLPYAEVAAVLGGTEAAARRAAADGVRALRAVLGRPEPDRSRPGDQLTVRSAMPQMPPAGSQAGIRSVLSRPTPTSPIPTSPTSSRRATDRPTPRNEEVHDARR